MRRFKKFEKIMTHNPILVNSTARFTVIDPHCVRLEYSPQGIFIDEPSLFAVCRQPDFTDFTCDQSSSKLRIETNAFELVYQPDDKVFHDGNLAITVKQASSTTWYPGLQQTGNLGGTLQSLDAMTEACDLGEGLLSKDGWYLKDDSSNFLLAEGWLKKRPPEHYADWYFFAYGRDYKAALRSLFKLAGSVPLPRKFVFGSWYSRWWSYTQQEFLDLVDEYNKHDFPLDVIVMDMGWHRQDAVDGIGSARNLGWTGWSWNYDLIPDPADLLAKLKKNGIAVTLNVHPHGGVRRHEDVYEAFMSDLGEETEKKRWLPFDAGSREYMEAYFKHTHTPNEDIGVDFWWLDWQQDQFMPHVLGYPGLKHLSWLNFLYHRHTSRNNLRGLSFSRWAGWGDHRHPIHFSGDANSNWNMLAFEVLFTATAGNVGCFFWSHDLGGFYGERNPEMYARWVQFGSVSAAMRIHSDFKEALDRRPWKWGEPFESSMRKSFHFRSELMPYIYSSAAQSCRNGIPLNRPMYLDYPDSEDAYDQPQQFMFGDLFIAAPVTSQGRGDAYVAGQKVWLPQGDWYHFFTHERFDGGKTIELQSAIDSFPLMVKAGFPVPMQPYAPRMTTALEHPIIRCFPGRAGHTGRFELYEDDGSTRDYANGSYRLTLLECTTEVRSMIFKISVAHDGYKPVRGEREWRIEIPDTRKAESVDSEEINADIAYDAFARANIIRFSAALDAEPVNLTVRFKEKLQETAGRTCQARGTNIAPL